MRVLLVTAEYPLAPTGGIGVFYHELARALTMQGATVCVLAADPTIDKPNRREESGVDVRRIPAPAPRPVRFAGMRFDAGPLQRARALTAAAGKIAAELQPDVVETHDWAAPLWRPPLPPFVVRLHGSSTVLAAGCGKRPPRLLRCLERRMLAQADAVVAVSEWVRERSAGLFALPAEPMRVIPSGVDVERFRPGAGPRTDQVVYAGAIREDKGVAELLQALAIVFRQQPGAAATLAGGPDGWDELPPRIRAQIERLQMAAPGRLHLTGRVDRDELLRLFQRAGVCVFPSHVEAFGLACVEAMSCGAPVIAGQLAAGAEIVEHGRSGLLVDPREPEKIAGAISRLLAESELARRLGQEARRRAVERYSIQRTAERTLALYEEVRSAKRPWHQQPAA